MTQINDQDASLVLFARKPRSRYLGAMDFYMGDEVTDQLWYWAHTGWVRSFSDLSNRHAQSFFDAEPTQVEIPVLLRDARPLLTELVKVIAPDEPFPASVEAALFDEFKKFHNLV